MECSLQTTDGLMWFVLWIHKQFLYVVWIIAKYVYAPILNTVLMVDYDGSFVAKEIKCLLALP